MSVPFALVLALVAVDTGETCPAAADVEQRVRAILQLLPDQELSERFSVERHEGGLFVELQSAESSVIGQRLLPLEGSCDELSQAAAVVLSAWLTDVHPDFATALPQVAPEAAPAEPEPAAPVEPPAPKPARPPRIEAPPPEHRALPRRPYRVELGAGAGAALSGKLAFSAIATAAYLPETSGFGATSWLSVDTSRVEPLGDAGSVSWRRWPVGVGPTFRWQTASASLDFTLGPALTWLRLRGVGFSPNYDRNAATWSAFGSARLASRGPLGIFGLFSTQFYLGESTAYAAGAEYGLPRFSLSLFIGAKISP